MNSETKKPFGSNGILDMLTEMANHLKRHWQTLILAEMLYKVIAYALLVPVVSLIFRAFLYLDGRSILTDTDIASFFLHPLGWLSAIIVGGGLIGVSALEIATLMTIIVGSIHHSEIHGLAALWYVKQNAAGIFRMTGRMVLTTLVQAAPFIVIGGGLFLFFLTDHDINFYLSKKPAKFIVVACLIGVILGIMFLLILRSLANWAFAIPLYLFENLSSVQSLEVSQKRMRGQRLRLAKWIGVWASANFVIGVVASGIILVLTQFLLSTESNSVLIMITLLGIALSVWGTTNFLIQIFGTISFVLVLSFFYNSYGKTEVYQLRVEEIPRPSWSLALTPTRLIAGIILAFVGTSFIGLAAVRTVRLEDRVEVTAHRGASAKAPENTMAAVQQAIADGTDWVEIDVQESKDGVVVVAHDSDLKKVAGNPMKIWEGTAEELRTIDIGSYFDPKFKHERVPTLKEVLEACRGHVHLNIELKYYGHTQNLEQKVVDLVEETGMADDVVIMSLKQAGIQKIKQLRPSWTVGLLTAVAASDITRADADFLAVSTKLATRRFIDSAHQRQKRVHTWTVNDASSMSVMIGRGADNIITDNPELAKQVLQERLLLSPLERVLLEFSFLIGSKEIQLIEQ